MGKLALLILMLLLFIPAAGAEDVSEESSVLSADGVPELSMLFDMDMETAQRCGENASLRLYREEGIAGLYFIFDREYDSLTLTEEPSGTEAVLSTDGILHDYVDLQQVLGHVPQAVTVTFSSGEAALNELRLFSPGELPGWVQRWNTIPEGGADLLLLSTHGDDEQLFFAGLLPWYAGEQGKRVQVVYFTDHRNLTSCRVHEMLDGLWAVGVRDYPVFGPYDDYYTFDREDAYRHYEQTGHPRQELLGFVTEQLRRYRPLVAVGHDRLGEYGHGMHQLTADLLMEAVQISSEPDAFPEQDQRYGSWLVPKTYLHLYPENRITMNWDIPLAHFQGLTAYQLTKERGFPCHASQIKDFAWYFRGADLASQVEQYSPCQYGLYQTSVGTDAEGGDFFEHLEDFRKEPAGGAASHRAPEQPAQAHPSQQQPEEKRADPEGQSLAERNWLILPAVGTAALTVLTLCLSLPPSKEKS